MLFLPDYFEQDKDITGNCLIQYAIPMGVEKKITRRTTGAKGNNFLQVIASFNMKASNSKKQIERNR